MAQGPTPMALGPYAFRALGLGFNKQSLTLDTSWASLDTVGRLESLQWTGPSYHVFDIDGAVFEESFGGQASLDGIKSLAENGVPAMLVTRGGRVHGLHVIESIREDRTYIRGDGVARKNAFSIGLRRYGGSLGGLAGQILRFL